MKHARKRKKKTPAKASKPVTGKVVEDDDADKERKALNALADAFSFASLNDVGLAYREAKVDLDKAAELLSAGLVDSAEDRSTSSGWGSSSCSGSLVDAIESNRVREVVNVKGFRGSNKQKRLVAATGTVSTVLGKDYVRSTPKLFPRMKLKGFSDSEGWEEDAEQFLFSMLGDECELSMAIVRDVLCQCGYDVEKAMDALLDLSASSSEQLTDRASDSTSNFSESEESLWSLDSGYRNYAQALSGSASQNPYSLKNVESLLPQKILESLFNISKSPEHDPSTMNWRSVSKKLQSLGPGFDVFPSRVIEHHQDSCVKGEEYQVYRKVASQHWESTKSYYQKAASAHSKGERAYASYLSDQGMVQTKLAQQADEKASHDIFMARNKDIENVVTIDLHGQHVKQAMRLIKLHLIFGSYIPSIQILRVITGCGSHGLGKSKLKQSILKLLDKEGVEWSEENQGTVLIKHTGPREFSFMDSESDTD